MDNILIQLTHKDGRAVAIDPTRVTEVIPQSTGTTWVATNGSGPIVKESSEEVIAFLKANKVIIIDATMRDEILRRARG